MKIERETEDVKARRELPPRWTKRLQGSSIVKCKRELASSEGTMEARQDVTILSLAYTCKSCRAFFTRTDSSFSQVPGGKSVDSPAKTRCS